MYYLSGTFPVIVENIEKKSIVTSYTEKIYVQR